MDPISILTMAISLGTTAWKAAKAAGLIGHPDWEKYADAGLSVLQKASEIAAKIQSGSTDYDHLTPEEIESLLKPETWEEIEAAAKRELGG